MSETLDKTIASVERMQKFDPSILVRKAELGSMSFEGALQPANRLIGIYKRITKSCLEDLPDSLLNNILNTANSDFSRFEQILQFSLVTQGQNIAAQRDGLVSALDGAYANTFSQLWQYIAYGVSKATDVQVLESEARGVIQTIKDDAKAVTKELEASREDAKGILSEVRKVAAEHGVSQQAVYFKDEAEAHNNESKVWRSYVRNSFFSVVLFALITLIAAYVPFLEPNSAYQAAQLIAGKLMIFGVLVYLLGVCVRNYQAHRHNEIVNRHRENALKTFKALADGAVNPDNKDIVLTHAAQCIFTSQETGYSKAGGSESSGNVKSVIELLPKALTKSTE
ncbi:hypothetical protein BUE93_09670 [Chromobacterium amazonense]|uniref:Uncharacterized protein n=1 Tax=Chromobacterium amazonense TaxID=1382803 RepID=A0A2S9X5F0_9NEIS|nr:hypothetical protein [Chromobacterium amazonense]PRP70917.1 hypothetical protein BUE93_09670 [Chromobacterium amazonense]